jgi:RNA polymerase sigma factor for flagellar operon FliA
MKGTRLYAVTAAAISEDELIRTHLPLVKRIAYHLVAKLPAQVQADDLMQAGLIGLLEAARHYDAGHGASFETYAGIRIRGAMIDEIRRHDWVPRSVHRRAREIGATLRALEQRYGRHATDAEIATALGLSLEAYHQSLLDNAACRLFSLDEEDGEPIRETLADCGADPQDSLEREDLKRELAQYIAGLPERERLVLALYYDEELNLREIGEVLGVSESRVCQIHNQALLRLRAHVGGAHGQ